MNTENDSDARDPIIVSTELVYEALKPLDDNSRERVISAVRSLFAAPASSEPPASQHTRPVSLVELKREKQPRTYPQRIALYAYFRDKYEKQPKFSRKDLKKYFELAKDPFPGKNYGREFENAVKKGWIHEAGSNSYLTSTGVAAVEAGFSAKRKGSAM